MAQSMEVNQYFFGQKSLRAEQVARGFKDGFHVDVVLKDAFLKQFIVDKRDELVITRGDERAAIHLEVAKSASSSSLMEDYAI